VVESSKLINLPYKIDSLKQLLGVRRVASVQIDRREVRLTVDFIQRRFKSFSRARKKEQREKEGSFFKDQGKY